MGLKNRFHVFLFDLIAFGYQWFFTSQYRNYRKRLEQNIHLLELKRTGKVLDIGCGTGAFAKSFQDYGFEVIGIDASSRMVKLANQNGILAQQDNILQGLKFSSNSFDLVIAANVAHGLNPQDRIQLYKEALRVSRGKVLFHDYNKSTNIYVSIIETLENGYYRQFRSQVPDDFYQIFDSVEILATSGTNAWYLCIKEKNK